MKFCTTLVATLVVLAFGLMPAEGDTVIVNDNFQGYTDTPHMQQTWLPSAFGADQNYALADENVYFINPDPPPAGPFTPGDKAAWHVGGDVAIWQSFGNALNNAKPSATQKVVLQYDMWDEADSGNKRVSVGLRQVPAESSPGSGVFPNLFEMGVYNNSLGHYAMRMLSFPGIQRPAGSEGGWFGYDNLTDDNGVPIAPTQFQKTPPVKGWHTLRAEFEETQATFTIDLNRDGFINGSVVVPYTSFHTANGGGFHQIRFGGPSGITSLGGGVIFDNIYLALEDIVEPPGGVDGDFNDDGKVDAADYVVWRKNNGGGTALPNDGGLGTPIGPDHYNLWVANFGDMEGGGGIAAGGGAVPEPSTMALVMIGLAALAARRRSR